MSPESNVASAYKADEDSRVFHDRVSESDLFVLREERAESRPGKTEQLVRAIGEEQDTKAVRLGSYEIGESTSREAAGQFLTPDVRRWCRIARSRTTAFL